MNFSPPVEIAAWLGCLYFVVALFNASTKAWFNVRGKPTPFEQQQATQHISERVTKIESCQGDHGRRLTDVEAETRRLRKRIGTEIDKVFNRVNSVATDVATGNGALEVIKSQLTILISRRDS